MVYSLVALARKQGVRRLIRAETPRASKRKTFPASFNLRTWLSVSEKEDEFESALVDAQKHVVLWRRVFPKQPLPSAVEKSLSLLSVRGFQNSVIFPYWLHETEDGVDHIAWRDLSYSFSRDVELYALHVRVDTEGTIVQNEFHERW